MGTCAQVISDLKYIFEAVPLECLLHLRSNKHRLVRGAFVTDDGRGCLMYLLTEALPPARRITSKKALTRFFGGDPEAPHYQPARWIVRLWDGAVCEIVRSRYGEHRHLSTETVIAVLEEVIATHTATDLPDSGVRLQAATPSFEPLRQPTLPSTANAA